MKLATTCLHPLLNALANCDAEAARLLDLALENTDKRLAQKKSVTPAFPLRGVVVAGATAPSKHENSLADQ